jgi:DNA-binding XRE family transcriptional regulator
MDIPSFGYSVAHGVYTAWLTNIEGHPYEVHMADTKNRSDVIEWRPEWEGDDLAYFERARAAGQSAASAFRKVREELGLTQIEVAQLLGITQSNVSKIEAKTGFDLTALAQLVHAKGGTMQISISLGEKKKLKLTA